LVDTITASTVGFRFSKQDTETAVFRRLSKFSEVVYTRSGDEIEYSRNRPHLQDRRGKDPHKPNLAVRAQIILSGLSLALPPLILSLLMWIKV
jgi:hypothetical protein